MQAYSLHGMWMHRKPVLIVAEEEERFYPFDYDRWTKDKLQKAPDSSEAKGFVWVGGVPNDGLRFDKCPQAIKDFIGTAWSSQADEIIFFRRRDFEACSLAREIVRRASGSGVTWGGSLPLTSAWQVVRSGPRLQVRVRLLWDEGSPVGCGMAHSLRKSLSELNVRYKYKEERAIFFADEPSLSDDGRSDETHFIVVLTDLQERRWLAKDMPAEQQLLTALKRLDSKAKFIVVYDKPKGLSSPIFGQISEQIDAVGIQQLLWNHEALIFRHETPKCGAVVQRFVLGAVSIRLCGSVCVAGGCDSRLALISSTALCRYEHEAMLYAIAGRLFGKSRSSPRVRPIRPMIT
jgi:hypothetical protein